MIGGLDLSKTPAIMKAGTTKKGEKMKTQEKIAKLYTELQGSNIDQYISKKDTGRIKLDYLSWGAAVDFFTKACHALNLDWTYSHEFVDMGARGSFVSTTITILDAENGETVDKTMSLPCMTNTNQAAKDADVTTINKTQMRCLVKCMTLFGLGLSLYLKDFSELDDVKLASEVKQDEYAKQITEIKRRIKVMWEKLDPAIDTAEFNGWESCNDKAKLLEIGKALKKLEG
jgi:hypothetical protein